MLNALVDCYLCFVDGPQIASETIRRANAYVEAGANCVSVVDVTLSEETRLLTKEISARLNVLAMPGLPSVQELKDLGVARLTLGSSLARAAYSEAARVVLELRERGEFATTTGVVKNQELNQVLSTAGRDPIP